MQIRDSGRQQIACCQEECEKGIAFIQLQLEPKKSRVIFSVS